MKETILFIFIILFSLVNCMAQELIVQNLRPSVVKTFPQCGDLDVNPDIATVTVTFSKDMIHFPVCQMVNIVLFSLKPVLKIKNQLLIQLFL